MNEIYDYEAHLNENTQISSQASGDVNANSPETDSQIFANDDLQENYSSHHQQKNNTTQSNINIERRGELKPCNDCECCIKYQKQFDLLTQRLSTLESSCKTNKNYLSFFLKYFY